MINTLPIVFIIYINRYGTWKGRNGGLQAQKVKYIGGYILIEIP